MKKRSGGISKGHHALPLTEADRHDRQRSGGGRGPRSSNARRVRLTPLQTLMGFFMAILALGFTIAMAQRFFLAGSSSVDADEQERRLVAQERDLPLQDFSSLQYALRNSEITLLYFAAAWCPMSTQCCDTSVQAS